jgi:hypothetical protein
LRIAQHFLIDARLVIKPLAIRDRRELDEILVPLEILRQQQQVIRRLARIAARRRSLAPIAGAMYASIPRIGLIPSFLHSLKNSITQTCSRDR